MNWRDYVFGTLLLLYVCAVGYSWVWWLKTGRHQPNRRTARVLTALVFNTLLPGLFMGFLPMCAVSPSYALVGLPFAVLGFVLGQGELRRPLAICVLASYLMFTSSLPISPHAFRPKAGTKHTGC
jgi:hypothetical protein